MKKGEKVTFEKNGSFINGVVTEVKDNGFCVVEVVQHHIIKTSECFKGVKRYFITIKRSDGLCIYNKVMVDAPVNKPILKIAKEFIKHINKNSLVVIIRTDTITIEDRFNKLYENKVSVVDKLKF